MTKARVRWRGWVLALCVGIMGGAQAAPPAGAASDLAGLLSLPWDWPSAGRDLSNTRSQPFEFLLSPATVGSLQKKWALPVAGDVTANPAVDGDSLYFGDSAGYLYKVTRQGQLVWKQSVSALTGAAGDSVRATPAVAGNLLIMGNQAGKLLGANFGQPAPTGAKVFAVDKNTGQVKWVTQVDSTLMSMATHSPLVVGNLAIVGIASNEELVAGFVPQPYWQWQFRGSVVALDVQTGAIRWQTYTVPPGYYGGSVWGSTGAVDLLRQQVYIASGNNYWVPQSVFDCMNNGGGPASCLSPDDHFDSIMALDLATGHINWAQHGIPYDVWNVGCGLFVPGFSVPPNNNCPNPHGPDWDFAQGPILMHTGFLPGSDLVGGGQKSGMYWAFRASDGKLVWNTQVAPGGLTGGLQWGSAYDGRRIYVAVSNAGPVLGSGQDAQPWTLKDGSTTTSGGWAALNPSTGAVLWTTADPLGSRAEGAVSVANGVVYGCNLDYNPANPTYYALNAESGKPLWSFASGGPCAAGPVISAGMVFWGTGTFRGTGPKLVYGFGL